jgi:hypothetical protein
MLRRLSTWLAGISLAAVYGTYTIRQNTSQSLLNTNHWDIISSRDDPLLAGKRLPLYRALVPNDWQRQDTAPEESIVDTTRPLCSYLIKTEEGVVEFTIHNFPCNILAERIDPHAQVARWQRQLTEDNPLTTTIIPVHGAGFTGLKLYACGHRDEKHLAILAWSMQLAPEHFCRIDAEEYPYNRHYCRQRRADYTVKAVGNPASIAAASHALTAFVTSFELLHELPSSL